LGGIGDAAEPIAGVVVAVVDDDGGRGSIIGGTESAMHNDCVIDASVVAVSTVMVVSVVASAIAVASTADDCDDDSGIDCDDDDDVGCDDDDIITSNGSIEAIDSMVDK
jgi:hypothetical protein